MLYKSTLLPEQNFPHHRARQWFSRALLTGQRKRALAGLLGRSRQLIDLNALRTENHISGQYDAGLRTVRVDQIRGSLNRTTEFDIDFYPTGDHVAWRWIRVATAALCGIGLPAVDLVQVGDTYFVVDGHHRVSVARALRQIDIEAHVTVWNLDDHSR